MNDKMCVYGEGYAPWETDVKRKGLQITVFWTEATLYECCFAFVVTALPVRKI
jgi:hypothetical protein